MGGKKKRSLKQMVKTQKKTGKKEKRAAAAPSEKKSIPGITPPNLNDKVVGELKKMKVITPYSVASRFGLRLSIARTFLKELERKGMIEFVSKSRNLQIYKPAD
jgi:small subunit ribosomal protein S25e